MLALPGRLLPPGCLSETARAGPRELQVRLYRDRGHGPGMIRLSLSGRSGPGPRTGISAVAALSVAEARAVAADPRWGVRMDPALVRAGAREYPDVATFG